MSGYTLTDLISFNGELRGKCAIESADGYSHAKS
jgi:hypothetical protein